MQTEIQKMIPETAMSLKAKLDMLAPGQKLKAAILAYDEDGNVWLPDDTCEIVGMTPTGILLVLPDEAREMPKHDNP